jgi:hypothetical protein
MDIQCGSHREEEYRKIRVCVDFWNLNQATPKDEYPMPIADVLINNASGHRIIIFMDGNAATIKSS